MLGPEHFAQRRASVAASYTEIRNNKINRGQCVEQPATIHRLVVHDAISRLIDVLQLSGYPRPVDPLIRENALERRLP